MARKRFTPEQIINHLREAEILVNQGQTVAEACRQISVSEQTYYCWRKEYGGIDDLPLVIVPSPKLGNRS